MNINQLMKQAQKMQEQVMKMQEELYTKEFSGVSGGGAVEVKISGKGDLLAVKVNPDVIENKDDLPIVEDLIIAAFRDAKNKLDEETQGSMSGMMPAGFKLPF